MNAPPFRRIGPIVPATPVVIAVAHAGRNYPDALKTAARVPVERLVMLEDRYADLLIAQAVGEGATAVVADVARAWIDLNRHPDEVDATMIDPPPASAGLRDGPRIRAGLGLVPRRVVGVGEIWRGRIAAEDLAARIATVHGPYHRAVGDALAAARAAHGVAVLLDVHSMPPLMGADRGGQLVIGDLGGTSAGPSVTAAALAVARDHGLRAMRNRPYAGGHGVAEHGRPRAGVHAIQLEICRTLYLDAALRTPGAGLARMQALVAALWLRLGDAVAAAGARAAE